MTTVERVRDVAAAVARRNGASKAILFGSHARGTATARSDVDLLFIEETDSPYLKRLDRYYSPLVDELGGCVEVLVYTPAEVESRAELPFLRRILAEGMVLYERGEEPPRGAALAGSSQG